MVKPAPRYSFRAFDAAQLMSAVFVEVVPADVTDAIVTAYETADLTLCVRVLADLLVGNAQPGGAGNLSEIVVLAVGGRNRLPVYLLPWTTAIDRRHRRRMSDADQCDHSDGERRGARYALHPDFLPVRAVYDVVRHVTHFKQSGSEPFDVTAAVCGSGPRGAAPLVLSFPSSRGRVIGTDGSVLRSLARLVYQFPS